MIKIYINKDCEYCKELQEKLNDLKLEYQIIDIDDDKNKEHVQKIFDVTGEPLIPIINYKHHLLAPKRSFNTMDQAILLLKSLI